MPLQNRVTPYGDLIATPERWAFTGNRGRIHDEFKQVTPTWTTERWLICLLTYRDRHREVMPRKPGWYTNLFFLDEASAMSAGHRPCATCRRTDYQWFRKCFIRANRADLSRDAPSIQEIDHLIHQHRMTTRPYYRKNRRKVTYQAPISVLPTGVFVMLEPTSTDYYLVTEQELYLWTPQGYRDRRAKPVEVDVTVLTPRPLVGAIAAGYRPQIQEALGVK